MSNPGQSSGVEEPRRQSIGAGLLALAAFVLLAALSLGSVDHLEGREIAIRRADAAELGQAHLHLLGDRLDAGVPATQALAALVQQARERPFDQFAGYGASLLAQFPAAAALQLAPAGIVARTVPPAVGEVAIGRDLLHDDVLGPWAMQALQTRHLVLAGPVDNSAGGRILLALQPVFMASDPNSGGFWGFACALLPVDNLLAGTGFDRIPERGFDYALWRRGAGTDARTVIASSGAEIPQQAVELGIGPPGNQWMLSLRPTAGWISAAETWQPRLLAVLGSAVVAFLLYYLRRRPERLQTQLADSRRKLADSRDTCRILVRSIPGLAWMKDCDGRFLACNQAFEQLAGMQAAELIGRTDDVLVGASLRDLCAQDREAQSTGRASGGERWLGLSADGRRRCVRIVCTPMLGRYRENCGVLCVANDVTDLHRTSDELRASEARLAAAQRVAAIGSWERNLDTGEIYWSDEIYRLLELDPVRVEPHYDSFLRAIHPDDRDWVHSTYREAQRKFAPLQLQLRIPLGGGRTRHVEMRAEIARSDGDGDHRIFGTLQDITDRVDAQDRIRRQQAMTRAMLSAMPVGVAVTDAAGRLREFNAAASELLLSEPQSMIGKRIGELGLRFTGESGKPLLPDALADSIALNASEPSGEIECRVVRGAQANDLAMSAVPVSGDDMGVVIALVSLKARREAEYALREHADHIEALNRRFGVAAAAAGIGVWDFDLASQRFSWDEAMRHLHGIDSHRFDGSLAAWLERIEPGDRARLAMALEQARGGDDDMVVDYRSVRRGGDTHYLRVCARVECDDKGGVRRLTGVCLDMTTLKRSEQILIQERRRYRDLVDSTDGIVWEAEAESGRFTFVSRHAERLLGYPIEDWYANGFWAEHLHPDDREGATDFRSTMAAGGEAHEVEYRMLSRDGEHVWLRDIVTVVGEAGRIRWLRGVMVDVGESRRIASALERSREQLRLAIEGAGIGLWDWDIASGALEFGGPGLPMLGYGDGEPAPDFDAWERLIHIDDLPAVRERLVAHLQGHSERFVSEHRLRHRDSGCWVWVHALGQVVKRDEAGLPLRLVGIQLDVSERRLAEERAHRAQVQIERLSARNALLLNSAGEGIFGVDLDGRCIFINPMALELLGLTEDEAIDCVVAELFEHQDADGRRYDSDQCPILLTLNDGVTRQLEDTLVQRDGRRRAVRMTVTEIREDRRRIGVEVVFQDISARRAMERELERLATTDPLTGVTNRRQFIDRCEQELVRHKRFEHPVSLLMIDVDHFKRINDTHGHAIGDAVLVHLCALAGEQLRRTDVFARLGGEEFAFLLTGSDLDGAMEFAARFCRQVEARPAVTDAGTIALTISIGAAQASRRDRSADDLLRRADSALYRAKQGGRNRVEAEAI
ncbi:MAG: PAS domain S-box protein [Zoogloeaceae bacterium]|nr:PAS domain S-box protein [Rhodocyclaceae bacterium]MCP5235846.1 PAS domain S-box protein [Zoogloeaceae bacterium]